MTVSPQELVERALEASKSDDCVVIVEEVTQANLRWASNTLTTNGVARTQEVTVISVAEGAVGAVTRQGLTLDSLVDTVREADETARSGTRAEDQSPLIGPESSQGDWSAPPAETSIGVFSTFAPALGEVMDRASSAAELLFGFASHEMRTTYVGSSSGLRCRHDQPTGYVEINAKSADFARSAWAGVPSDHFGDVDMDGVCRELSRRLEWARRSVGLEPGRYDTILPPSAVADLMIYLYWSAEARDAHEGRTVFSRPGGGTRVGDQLTSVAVNLRSDPGDDQVATGSFVVAPTSTGGVSVFDNGSPLDPTAWISEGTLTALVQSRHSARLTGLPFTPLVDNLIMDGPATGSGGVDDLVRGVERGVLLTCLWYIREVDPQTLLLTGLTRDGVYLVEGGEVTGAVNNFRFNESPVDLLGRVVEAGRPERTLPREWSDYFTRTTMPALRVSDFNMSSVSQAS